jgi:hypothetical protein
MTSLDKLSARHRELYPTVHNTRETDIRAADGIESAIPENERLQKCALDRVATEIGFNVFTSR